MTSEEYIFSFSDQLRHKDWALSLAIRRNGGLDSFENSKKPEYLP
jgi:hypothetical protein